MKRAWFLVMAVLAGLSVGLAAKAGSFLVVDAPRPSDVILVLAGETDRRPERALELLAQGYGRRVVLDVPTNAKIYEFTQIQLAQKYIQDLPQSSVDQRMSHRRTVDQGRVEGCGEVPGTRRRQERADRDLGFPHPARAKRFPARSSRT